MINSTQKFPAIVFMGKIFSGMSQYLLPLKYIKKNRKQIIVVGETRSVCKGETDRLIVQSRTFLLRFPIFLSPEEKQFLWPHGKVQLCRTQLTNKCNMNNE